MIVHQHGAGTTASKEGSTAAYDLQWQALAAKWDCALLGPSYHVVNEAIDLTPGGSEVWFDPRHGSEKTFLRCLAEFSKTSGHPEIEKVPWVLWGHSGGGIWSDVMACLHPDRVAAMWLRSGTASMFRSKPEFPQPKVPDAIYQIPVMCNVGIKETNGGPWVGSIATFQEFRLHGAPIACAPDPRTGHECGDSRYLAIPFLGRLHGVAAAGQGQFKPEAQADRPKPVLPEASLLGRSAESSATFKGNPLVANWLPNQDLARKCEEYVKTGEVTDRTPPPAPSNVIMTPNGDAGTLLTWSADADFESGIRCFVIMRDGEKLAQVPEKPFGQYGLPLFQSMTFHDTPKQPLSEMKYVDASAKAGMRNTFTPWSPSMPCNSVPSPRHRPLRSNLPKEEPLTTDSHRCTQMGNPGPEGTTENSPAFQRRVTDSHPQSPAGTVEC